MKVLRYIGLFALVAMTSCISDIDFEVPPTVQNAIVIQSKLVKGDPSVIKVDVVNAFDFTGLSPTIRVSDATLKNVTKNQSLSLPTTQFNSRGAEIYDGDPNMDINYTDEYTLTVRTLDGQTFTSTPERLYRVPEPEKLSYEIAVVEGQTIKGLKTFDDVIRFKVDTDTRSRTGEFSRMRWAFSQVYSVTDFPIRRGVEPKTCYLTDNLGAAAEVSYDPNILGVDKIENFDLIELALTPTYATGSYFQATQQSLSEGAFQYFQEIQGLLSREGSVFDPPAGQVRTNFERSAESTSDVFGYFYLTEEEVVRVYVDPEDVGSRVDPICPAISLRPTACPVAICCDCLDANNSTTEKPIWWE